MIENETVVAEAPATETAAPISEAPAPAEKPDTFDMDAVLSEAFDRANAEPQPRGPDGKFVSTKEPEAVEETATEAVAPAEAQTEDQTSPEAVEPEPAAPAIEPPVSWSREMRDKWSSLPPEAQEYIARRESEAHGQISRLGQQVRALEPVAKTLEQYKGTFERNGMSYADGLNALLAAQAMLDVNPRAAILEIARSYGVDLGAEANTNDANPTRETLALQAKIVEQERQIAELRNAVQPLKQRFEESDNQAIQNEIADWSKDKPYFNELRSEMAAYASVVEQQNPGISTRKLLEKSYDLALRANDAIWQKIEGERRAKAAAEAKAKADQAKKVASLNVKSNTQARPAARTIDDDLASTWDRIHQAS